MKGLIVLGLALISVSSFAQSRKTPPKQTVRAPKIVCPVLAGKYEKCSTGSTFSDRFLGISPVLEIKQGATNFIIIDKDETLNATVGQKVKNSTVVENVKVDFNVSANCTPGTLELSYEVTNIASNDQDGDIIKEIAKDLIENNNTTYELNATTLSISGGPAPITCQKI